MATRVLGILSIALGLTASVSACAETIPEFNVKVVAEESGEPQEWIRLEMRAKTEVRNLQGVLVPTFYFYDLKYLWAKDGVITIRKKSFTVTDVVHYKGWEVLLSSPGHGSPANLKSEEVQKILASQERPYVLKLARQTAQEWASAGGLDVGSPPGWEAPTALTVSFEQAMFYVMHDKYVLDNWESYKAHHYYIGASGSPEGQLRTCMDHYLKRSSEILKIQARLPLDSPFRTMPIASIAANDCSKFAARYPALFSDEWILNLCREIKARGAS